MMSYSPANEQLDRPLPVDILRTVNSGTCMDYEIAGLLSDVEVVVANGGPMF
jgi:hypothetical protein